MVAAPERLTDTNGCDSGSLPIGTRSRSPAPPSSGTLVYNSWIAMQQPGRRIPTRAHTTTSRSCGSRRRDAAAVNPSVPGFGGPTGLAEPPSNAGATVFTYGNSSLRGGVTQAQPRAGRRRRRSRATAGAVTSTPSTPGHPGRLRQRVHGRLGARHRHAEHGAARAAARVQRRGQPEPEVAYARPHGFGGLNLVTGGPFNGEPGQRDPRRLERHA